MSTEGELGLSQRFFCFSPVQAYCLLVLWTLGYNVYKQFMNVKNLKEMFERQATIKADPPPPSQPVKKLSKPSVQVAQGQQITIETNNNSQESPPKKQSPKQRVSTVPTPNFLQELELKLARNSKVPGALESATLQAVARQPEPLIEAPPESQVSQEKELKMQDIISCAQQGQRSENYTKIRYGLDENDQKRSDRRVSGGDGSLTENVQQTSFSELLRKMLQDISSINQTASSQANASKVRKSKIVNKYDYEESNKKVDSKMKRIDFVINVVFGNTQFQKVESTMYKAEKLSKKTSVKKSIVPKIKPEKDTPIESIVKSSFQNQKDQIPRATVIKTPSMVDNKFLSQLSMKLQQKQQPKQNKKSHFEPQEKPEDPSKGKSAFAVTDKASLSPRIKKKSKAKQEFNFD